MSTFHELKASLLATGSLYEDPDFPAENNSVYFARPSSGKYDGIEWKRPSELSAAPTFFFENATRFDLDQGSLGNCWFLSAAANIVTKPEFFNKVVPSQTFDDYAGIFHFNFWRYGQWVEVFVDDRLPTKRGKLIFCKNRQEPDEFWAALLEKAYAKLHGSYQALESGYSHDALVDMTGGIGEFIDLLTTENTAKLYNILKRSFAKGSLICAAISIREGGEYEEKLENGLVTGHAYSVTKVQQLDIDGRTVNLLRLRNPWGFREWNGAWCESSEEWAAVDEATRLEMLMMGDDGEFWIEYGDFLQNFQTMQICHLTPDSVHGGGGRRAWCVATYHDEWVNGVSAGGCGAPPNQDKYWLNHQYYLSLTDTDDDDDDGLCTVVVSLMQKYRRRAKTIDKISGDPHEAIGIDLLKFVGNEPEELAGHHADSRVLHVEKKMVTYEYLRERSARWSVAPGTYCVVPVTYDPDVEGAYMLRIASEKAMAATGETGTLSSSQQQTEEEDDAEPATFGDLFREIAGDDSVLDGRELRKLLNEAFKQDKDEDFSKETARALIRWANESNERGGTLDMKQGRKVWKAVSKLQKIFSKHDKDESGLLERKELRQAFRGLFRGDASLSKRIVGKIVQTYCPKDSGLTFDDFVLVTTKIRVFCETYARKHEAGQTNQTLDEWLDSKLDD